MLLTFTFWPKRGRNVTGPPSPSRFLMTGNGFASLTCSPIPSPTRREAGRPSIRVRAWKESFGC